MICPRHGETEGVLAWSPEDDLVDVCKSCYDDFSKKIALRMKEIQDSLADEWKKCVAKIEDDVKK